MQRISKPLIVLLSAIIILVTIAAATATQVHAASGHITLLTVSDEEHNLGGTADLYLTVKPGDGAIYIDSFPLTRVDTQSSVRYANQIACDMLQEDCSRYDFFYTIRANSAIVGGPSAGGAITVLTAAVLDNQKLDQHIAMTGTINSGGIVGPVAGINAKVHGAKSEGITKVLIPALTSTPDLYANASKENDSETANQTNETNNATTGPTVKQEPLQLGRVPELSDNQIEVIRVGTVEEALQEFTGKNYSQRLKALEVPSEYSRRMTAIADDICNRTATLDAQVQGLNYSDTHNYTQQIQNMSTLDHQYSRASICFSKNIELATTLLTNMTADNRTRLYRDLRIQAKDLNAKTKNTSISTINDLETYAIVKERVIEAQDILDADDAQEPANLAYAQERLVSAKSWSMFFGMPGKEVQLDSDYLQQACLAKIGEAEERISYVRIYAPSLVDDSESLLEEAQGYSSNEPILCIFTASKAKAQANVLADALSIGQENVDALIQQKLEADTVTLEKQQEKGFFPILGYSYMQYAGDLRHRTPYSALIFSEYALELSNLDMYFPQKHRMHLPPGFSDAAILFGLGALFGAGISIFVIGKQMNARKAAAKSPESRPGSKQRMARSSIVGGKRRKGQKRA
jgi:uncharacterized protein